MQGVVAQLLSIANYGNAYLLGHPVEDYYPNDLAFKFCEHVKFVDLQSSGAQNEINDFASNPIDWFEKLKSTQVSQLRVRYFSTSTEQMSDRMSAAFVGGGGRWILEAVKPAKSDLWESKWEIGEKDAPEDKIWRVMYGRILSDAVDLPAQELPDARIVKTQLQTCLQKIKGFAIANGLDNFAECFERGITALNDSSTNNSYAGYELLPDNYGLLEQRQLLNACQNSWVFGGMGSWNDLNFSDSDVQAEYELLSDELFSLCIHGLVVSANLPTNRNNSFLASAEGIAKNWWKFWKRS